MDFIVKKFTYIIQIYKVYDANQKFLKSSIKFNMIIFREKKFKVFKFFSKFFLKHKNKHTLIRKFNTTSNEKQL
jgi:hypothetical protein